MKHCKRILFAITTTTLFSASAFADLLPQYNNDNIASAQQISTKVLIGNNTKLSLYNARIKLKAGNTWTSLGNIDPGQNTFTVHEQADDSPGVFEAQLENGQWLVTSYEKDHTGKIAFNLEACEDPAFKASLLKDYKVNIPALMLYSTNTHHTGLFPVPTKYADDEWGVNCASAAVGPSGIICTISSSPIVQYKGIGAGLGASVGIGYFSGNGYTPQQLAENYSSLTSTRYILSLLVFCNVLAIYPYGRAVLGSISGAGGATGTGGYNF